MEDPVFFPILLSIFTIFFIVGVHAQQPYIGVKTTLCNFTDPTSPAFGYSCNGVNTTCQSYLTFRSQPPFNSVSSISTLLSSNPSDLANLNSVTINSTFETNTLVLIPVTCSCSGQYYQFNTTYIIQQENMGFFTIANNTFQGLSVCDAISAQNPVLSAGSLAVGNRVRVPLRCACPTKNQTDSGFNYLLSYLVTSGDFIFKISSMFGVTSESIFQANGLSLSNSDIFPFTTLLVPLQDPPIISSIISPPPPPATPPPPFTGISTTNSPNNNNNHTWVYAVVGSVGGILLILGSIWLFIFINKKKTKKKMNDPFSTITTSESFEAVEKSDSVLLEGISTIAQSLNVYSFDELKTATSNFSPTCLIKGSVYRGRINGDLAAIKRMDGDVSKEIELMNKISHFNLLRLSGVCFNGENWYLVHEYASNGSLSDWIYNTSDGENALNWIQRIQIAFDVASGLNYIHNYTSPSCIHGDVKSSNILLDGEFRGKIANFTLSRSALGEDGSFKLTKHIVGTQGYMAPEYLENGLISTKIDVYAFGILLMEIVSGNEAGGLSDVVDSVIDDENGLKAIMDPRLEGKYPEDLAIMVMRIANGCVKREPSRRMGMDEVVQSLSRIMNGSLAWESSRS
ncbi:lysM domain receptor-like kinase 4 [Impatiens glandulifera]|uniref:lysM domain receptor-like kinase 4 n=1 Tax=Impatiens glandulifera TaxID=253017 RepID=UPI001FB12FA4|nr:lysM domain receptor-like kinase 4 [Impatiens glandulifera]